MKILLAQSMNYFGLGGAPKANRNMVEGLVQRGHSCTVISIKDGRDPDVDGVKSNRVAGIVELERNGIKVLSVENEIDQSVLLAKCIQELKPDWTLISEHGILLLHTALEADPSRVVLIAHSTIANLATATADEVKTIIRSLLMRTAGIITVSNYMKDYIRKWSGLESKVIYFPSYGTGPFSRFQNFGSGYVTMVNPCAYKGISIFSALARNLPGVRFAAVPTWGTTSQDRAMLAQMPNVTILEPSGNVDDIFALTKVLLVPSLQAEAFGQIAVEAMLRGIPVLASNAGGLQEAKLGVDYVLPVNVIEHYEMDTEKRVQPVIPAQNVTPWMHALQRVLIDRDHYEYLSTASRKAAIAFVSELGPLPLEQYLKQLVPALRTPREPEVKGPLHFFSKVIQ